MQQVSAFQATDGALFKTADECEKHELSLLCRKSIDSFIASPMNPCRATLDDSVPRLVIFSWERFKTGA